MLDILELIDEQTPSITVMEVARALDLPQSSTSALLRCLVEKGYLRRNQSTRAFEPTARFAFLGDWVEPRGLRTGALCSMVKRLRSNVNGGVVVASLSGVRLWYVHVAGEMVPATLRRSNPHSPLHCAAGQALLTRLNIGHVRGMIHRLNAEHSAVTVKPSDFLARLDAVRSRGYAHGDLEDGWHMTAVVVPSEHAEPLAIGVVQPGPVDHAGLEQTVRQLRRAGSATVGFSAAPAVQAGQSWSSVA